MKHLLSIALLTACVSPAHTEEHTVTEAPFHTEATLDAVFFPSSSSTISIEPKSWTDFTITSLVSQGAAVKKGDTLIHIDTEQIDKQIKELESSLVLENLALEQAKHELEQLKISTPRSLEEHARQEKQTAEDLAWYKDVGHAREIEKTKRTVKDAQMQLEYQAEELKQLEKMYAEDNKTEETEEIILKRTRDYVDRAKFWLESTKISADHKLKTEIPRKLEAMQNAARDAHTANQAAQETLPRELKQKQLGVAKAGRDYAKNSEKLTQLKADRAMMAITAPADGVVYYGSMSDGRWDHAAVAKVLKVGGKAPSTTPLMTFIPDDAELTLYAFAPEESLPALAVGAKGYATTSLNRYRNIPVTLSELASHPEISGTYRVALKPTLKETDPIVPGMKASVKIIGQQIDKALTVPTSFLLLQPDGSFTVKVKLADGKTEDRAVQIGASNQDTAVITKGLEKGQVIVK